jgi:hypothetical protein
MGQLETTLSSAQGAGDAPFVAEELDSIGVSGSAAQLTLMKGPLAREEL